MSPAKLQYRGDDLECGWCKRVKDRARTGHGQTYLVCPHCDWPHASHNCPDCIAMGGMVR